MTDTTKIAPVDLAEDWNLGEVDGVRVVTERVPGVRSVALAVWIDAGSRDEPDGSDGYAHFVEHLLFKGNDRWSAEAISTYFDDIGSDANAATTRDYTVVSTRIVDRHLEPVMGVLGELVLAPSFDPEGLDSEREVILEEIAMYDDSPSDVVHELADRLVFGSHPLGAPIIGTQDSIEAARSEGVAALHRAAYEPGRLVVSAAGNVDHAEFEQLVRTQLLAARGRSTAPGQGSASDAFALRERAAPTWSPGPRHGVVHKETEQVQLVLAGPGIARGDDRRYGLAILDTLLGGTPSSRLFLEVRERRGLAYSVYSFHGEHVDAGQVGAYVGVRPDRVAEALEVVAAELQRIRTEPPTAAELERACDHIEGRMLLSMESTSTRGNRLGASLVTGMPIDAPSTTLARLRAVTVDEVAALAHELLDPRALSFAAVAEDVDACIAAAREALGVVDVATGESVEALWAAQAVREHAGVGAGSAS